MKTPLTNCPTCQKENTWQKENNYRPFCCERCKLIDLGEWAGENRKIADNSPSTSLISDDDDSCDVSKY